MGIGQEKSSLRLFQPTQAGGDERQEGLQFSTATTLPDAKVPCETPRAPAKMTTVEYKTERYDGDISHQNLQYFIREEYEQGWRAVGAMSSLETDNLYIVYEKIEMTDRRTAIFLSNGTV